MTVSAIAAMDSNRVIGASGRLPWRIPEDFQYFKDKTMKHIMIMGRKTFESLGKPLPGRLHVVITRQNDYSPPGAHVFHAISEALDFCRSQIKEWGDEVFIIGGGEIYAEMLPYTDRIYLTEIHQAFEGDTRFPEFDKRLFRESARVERRAAPIPFDFVIYDRAPHAETKSWY